MYFAYAILPLGGAATISFSCRCGGFSRFRKLNWSAQRRISIVTAAARNSWSNGENLYEILGVSPGASDKEIKRAYRRRALKLHPDVNKEPNAEEKFMRIKQAYQTLVDPSKRAKYEASKRSSERRQKSSRVVEEEEDFYGLDDFFRDLQAEFEQKKDSTPKDSQPKSLWEELAELGEEFLEFLEKELNVDSQQQDETNGQARAKTKKADEEKEEEDNKQMESQIDEIEELLTKLKNELGLQ